MTARAATVSYVYCVQQGSDGPVKIGWTAADPLFRLSQLQVGNPQLLRLLGVIPSLIARKVEEDLHEILMSHWIRGEWFVPHAEVFAAFDAAREEHRIGISQVEEAA